MQTASFLRLFALAAIWGGSFLFLRIAAPVLGPVLLIEFRVALAAVFLFGVGAVLQKRLHVRDNWRQYLILGLFSAALPFLLFAFAAQTLSASLLSILNATSPIWGALIAAVWSRTWPSLKTMTGLAIGIAGVALIVGVDPFAAQPGAGIAVIAALGAAFSYGIATNYARTAQRIDVVSSAHGTMWAATLLILPALPFFPAYQAPSIGVAGAVLALGVVCSGIAYLLYFRLVEDLGATSALSVTFLIPMFGILWGRIFLGEPLGVQTVLGSLVVLIGTALVTGFSPQAMFKRSRAGACVEH